MYKILNDKRLDWLKRENYWKPDKIDFYNFLIFITIFLLAINYGEIFFLPMMTILIGGSFIGHIRMIKTTPEDIESKLMSSSICFGFIFSILLIIVSIIVFIGRLFAS